MNCEHGAAFRTAENFSSLTWVVIMCGSDSSDDVFSGQFDSGEHRTLHKNLISLWLSLSLKRMRSKTSSKTKFKISTINISKCI